MKEVQAGTVLQSNVKRRHTGKWASNVNARASPGVLLNVAGTMTVEIDLGGVVELEIPGHIVRHLVDASTLYVLLLLLLCRGFLKLKGEAR